MPVELIVPTVGESITEVEIGDWLKKEGESVDQDEPVVVLETEKVTVELPAPASGTITTMLKRKGEKASVGDVIGYMEPNGRPKHSENEARPEPGAEPRSEPRREPVETVEAKPAVPALPVESATAGRQEQIVPMTPIRRRIAER